MGQVQHILIYLKGDLILLKRISDGSYESCITLATPAKKEPYLLIKTMSHFLVELHMRLTNMFQKKLTIEAGIDSLKVLRDQLITLQHDYPDIVRDESIVIKRIISMIDNASLAADLEQTEARYKIFFMSMKAHHERYGRTATSLQLKGLDEIISSWLSEFQIDLKSTYILIVGARAPKKGLIEKQYFEGLRSRHGISPENNASGGIAYIEMLPEQMDIDYHCLVKDLARDLANQNVAEDMLNDRKAMYKDVLGDYAPPILLELENTKEIVSHTKTGHSKRFYRPKGPDEFIGQCPFYRDVDS
jgi:hypothetical protein